MINLRSLMPLALILLLGLACSLPIAAPASPTPTVDAQASQTADAAQLAATLDAYVGSANASETAKSADATALAQPLASTGTALAATLEAADQAQAATAEAQGMQATVQAIAAKSTAMALDATANALANPPPPPWPPLQVISFASGATSATIDSALIAGETTDYVIRAQAEQTMLVNVYSPADNVYLGVVGLTDGVPLLRTAAEKTQFRGKLPATQDYRLSLAAPFAPSSYTLQVIIPARIQFQPGAISASLDGKLAGGETNHYLAWANAGQTMSVKINSPANDVLLTIYGFEDGMPLVRYVSGAWEWSGPLHAAQDYMIEAISVGGTTQYTLEVVIQ